MLLLGVLEDTLAAEHLLVRVAIELYLLARMHLAVLDASHLHRGCRLRLCVSLHGEPCQHLVIDRQVVRLDLV